MVSLQLSDSAAGGVPHVARAGLPIGSDSRGGGMDAWTRTEGVCCTARCCCWCFAALFCLLLCVGQRMHLVGFSMPCAITIHFPHTVDNGADSRLHSVTWP